MSAGYIRGIFRLALTRVRLLGAALKTTGVENNLYEALKGRSFTEHDAEASCATAEQVAKKVFFKLDFVFQGLKPNSFLNHLRHE